MSRLRAQEFNTLTFALSYSTRTRSGMSLSLTTLSRWTSACLLSDARPLTRLRHSLLDYVISGSKRATAPWGRFLRTCVTEPGAVRRGFATSVGAWSSRSASRMIRRGSYCLGSSFFHSSSSKSGPSSSFMRSFAPEARPRRFRTKRPNCAEYAGNRSGPMRKRAITPMRRSFSMVSPNDTPLQ